MLVLVITHATVLTVDSSYLSYTTLVKNFSMWYHLLAKSISTSNHMFGRAIWDKLPKCIFENFEIAWVKPGQFQNFQNHEGDTSQKLLEPNMRWLVNHIKPINTLYRNWYLLTAGNYKSVSGQLQNWRLQNNTVNGAMSKRTFRLINQII